MKSLKKSLEIGGHGVKIDISDSVTERDQIEISTGVSFLYIFLCAHILLPEETAPYIRPVFSSLLLRSSHHLSERHYWVVKSVKDP